MTGKRKVNEQIPLQENMMGSSIPGHTTLHTLTVHGFSHEELGSCGEFMGTHDSSRIIYIYLDLSLIGGFSLSLSSSSLSSVAWKVTWYL